MFGQLAVHSFAECGLKYIQNSGTAFAPNTCAPNAFANILFAPLPLPQTLRSKVGQKIHTNLAITKPNSKHYNNTFRSFLLPPQMVLPQNQAHRGREEAAAARERARCLPHTRLGEPPQRLLAIRWVGSVTR